MQDMVLAKSNPKITLKQHTYDVITTGLNLLKVYGNHIEKIIHPRSLQDLYKDFIIAAYYHDVGKADKRFQRMLKENLQTAGFRHEVIGAILLSILYGKSGIPYINAVLTHHMKSKHATIKDSYNKIVGKTEAASAKFSYIEKVNFSNLDKPDMDDVFFENNEISVYNSVLANLLISADRIASAKERTGQSLDIWKPEVHPVTNLLTSDLGFKNKIPYSYQETVAASTSNITLLTAPCGTGKTYAALQWAHNNLIDSLTKVFFCFPTQTTASAAVSPYLNKLPGITIQHQKAIIDMERNISFDENIITNRLIFCTVDTVLGLMGNYSSCLVTMPFMTNALYIFDEIHTYDNETLKQLINFMRIFKSSKFLLMTATITPDVKRFIYENCTKISEVKCEITADKRDNPIRWVKSNKYQVIEYINSIDNLVKMEIETAKQSPRKILVIVNTIGRAISLYNKLKDHIPTLCFHSRFKYKDLRHKRNLLFDKFSEPESFLLISTQVAEISLDISADVLITDIAPVPNLIQRMGRVNRNNSCVSITHICKDRESLAKAKIIYKTSDPAFEGWLEIYENWIKRVGDGLLHPFDFLTKIPDNGGNRQLRKPKWETYFNDPFLALKEKPTESIRNSDEYHISCIMKEDWDRAQNAQNRIKEILEAVINMGLKAEEVENLEKDGSLKWNDKHNVYVVDEGLITYDSETGGRWITP